MDGEQRFPINLGTNLDVNSGDMLVPASSPLFSYNKQQYLGNLLQNSIRYERDGWFVGNYGYDFSVEMTGDLNVAPPMDIEKLSRVSSKYFPGFVFKFKGVKGNDNVSFIFALANQTKVLSGSLTSIATVNGITTINGKTEKNSTFVFTYNCLTGAVTFNDNSNDLAYEFGGSFTNGYFDLSVKKDANKAGTLVVRKAADVAGYVYNFNGTNHTWLKDGKGFHMLDSNIANTTVDAPMTLVGNPIIVNGGTVSEEVRVNTLTANSFLLSFIPEMKDYWKRVKFPTELGSFLTPPPDPIIKACGSFFERNNAWNSKVTYLWNLPVWLYAGIRSNIKFADEDSVKQSLNLSMIIENRCMWENSDTTPVKETEMSYTFSVSRDGVGLSPARGAEAPITVPTVGFTHVDFGTAGKIVLPQKPLTPVFDNPDDPTKLTGLLYPADIPVPITDHGPWSMSQNFIFDDYRKGKFDNYPYPNTTLIADAELADEPIIKAEGIRIELPTPITDPDTGEVTWQFDDTLALADFDSKVNYKDRSTDMIGFPIAPNTDAISVTVKDVEQAYSIKYTDTEIPTVEGGVADPNSYDPDNPYLWPPSGDVEIVINPAYTGIDIIQPVTTAELNYTTALIDNLADRGIDINKLCFPAPNTPSPYKETTATTGWDWSWLNHKYTENGLITLEMPGAPGPFTFIAEIWKHDHIELATTTRFTKDAPAPLNVSVDVLQKTAIVSTSTGLMLKDDDDFPINGTDYSAEKYFNVEDWSSNSNLGKIDFKKYQDDLIVKLGTAALRNVGWWYGSAKMLDNYDKITAMVDNSLGTAKESWMFTISNGYQTKQYFLLQLEAGVEKYLVTEDKKSITPTFIEYNTGSTMIQNNFKGYKDLWGYSKDNVEIGYPQISNLMETQVDVKIKFKTALLYYKNGIEYENKDGHPNGIPQPTYLSEDIVYGIFTDEALIQGQITIFKASAPISYNCNITEVTKDLLKPSKLSVYSDDGYTFMTDYAFVIDSKQFSGAFSLYCDGGTDMDEYYFVLHPTLTSLDTTYTVGQIAELNDGIFTVAVTAAKRETFNLQRMFIYQKTGMFSNERIVSGSLSAFKDINNVTFSISGALNSLVSGFTPLPYGVQYNYIVDITDVARIIFFPNYLFNMQGSNATYISSTANSITFKINNNTYVLTFATDFKTDLVFNAIDIRDDTSEEHVIYKEATEDLKIFKKQHWSNDVKTENYWYINSGLVLELTTAELVLWEKVTGLDDWKADKWSVAGRVNRDVYISVDDLYFTVSNAYKASGIFYRLQNLTGSVRIIACTITKASFTSPDFKTIDVPLTNVKDKPFVSTGLCYTDLLLSKQVVMSTKSSLVKSGHLFLGFRITKCILQWTVDIDLSTWTVVKVINAYGCVGINGVITGNHLPTQYMSVTQGFDGTINSVMKDFEKDKIYGNDEAIYFIQDMVTDTVSHITIGDAGVLSFDNNKIPLTSMLIDKAEEDSVFCQGNALDLIYETFGDTLQAIANLQSNHSAAVTISTVANLVRVFSVFVSMPSMLKFSITMFSYAFTEIYGIVASYVWRMCEETVNDDQITDASINVTTTKYNNRCSNNMMLGYGAFAVLIANVVAGSLSDPPKTVVSGKINETQNQSAISDKGKKYSAMASKIAANTISDIDDLVGDVVSLKIEVENITSLDDYYKVSSQDKSYYGPGFVNHNMIGQCNVVSYALFRSSGGRYNFVLDLSNVSVMITQGMAAMKQATMEILQGQVDANQGGTSGFSPGPTLPIGQIIAAIMAGGQAIVAFEAKIGPAITEMLSKIFENIGPKQGAAIRGSTAASGNDVEGRHTYGNRPVSMFYPSFDIDNRNDIINETITLDTSSRVKKIDLLNDEVSGDKPSYYILIESGTRTANVLNYCSEKDLPPIGANPSRDYYIACNSYQLKGLSTIKILPEDTALIDGTSSMLPNDGFRNEQIGVKQPIFQPPSIHDYCMDEQWGLAFTCIGEDIIHVSIDDTKVIDGTPSNIVIEQEACCMASSYLAVEVSDFDVDYLRPAAITPTALGLNITRINSCYDNKAYHAFDGLGNRIVLWRGGSGFDKNITLQQQMFVVNKHFKRSSIFPPSLFSGNFTTSPNVSYSTLDNEQLVNVIVNTVDNKQTGNSIVGENKNVYRFSLPVFTELLSTLPAVTRSIAPYKLNVIEGVTSLTTDIRNTQSLYKAPSSVDFSINGDLYRATDEFVCSITNQSGVNVVQELVASVGLQFIGATTTEAYFYSMATRCYYKFSGAKSIEKAEPWNRFDNITMGRWDFINQEVVFKCLHDNEAMICRLNGQVEGEIWTPPPCVAKDGDFKILSVSGGLVLQGPKRYTVNRFLLTDNMIDQIRFNKRRWIKASREDFFMDRDYGWKYEDWYTQTPSTAVKGWTHNAWELATAMLGAEEEADCRFEWILNFCWTEQMQKLYGDNEYITINLKGETITQGGTVMSEVTHLYLYKQLFTRKGINGYYSFTFQSNNGTGNRERLYMWSDGYIAIEDVVQCCKQITNKRASPLTIQQDIAGLIEQ